MNSPEMHVADSAIPEPENESDEIQLLRAQIVDLTQKARNLRARWSIAIAIALIGLAAPLGMLTAYRAVAHSHHDRAVADVEKVHADRILAITSDVVKMVEIAAAAGRAAALAGDEATRKQIADKFEAATTARTTNLDEVHKKGAQAEDAVTAGQILVIFCAPWLFPLIYVGWIALSKRMMEHAKLKLEYKIVAARARQLQDKIGEDFFTRLVQINFKYLDQYYFQTHQQANKSFALSVAASIVGLAIVVAAIGMMMVGHKEPGYLTAVVGGLTQFISAVFFYLYNRTVLKMGEYHKKLVLTQNIGIALKITDLLPPEDKAQTQRALVGQLTLNINQYLAEIETAIAPSVPALVPAQ